MKLITATAWGIYSVWWRHFQVYRSTWLVSMLPPLSEPLVYLLAFGYGLTPLVGEVEYLDQSISYARFIAPGMIAVGVLFQSFFEGAYGSFIRLNFQKTWQALLTAPLSFTDFWGIGSGQQRRAPLLEFSQDWSPSWPTFTNFSISFCPYR